MSRQSPGMSPASSTTSLSGSLTPRDSTGPLSPSALGAIGDRPKKSGGGIQMQIQQLQDEQERVQKKTFTNWMNSYLKQKSPPLKVENLFEDIKDGVVLLSLLEVLSGEKLPMERGKLKRVHYVSNLSTALKFLESKKIKLVNINVSDIADGKASIVLGLIWTIILYFQIEETMSAQQNVEGEQKPLSALDKFRMNAKKALLAWTENAITKRYGIEIRDFGKSWRDGLAFNAIVHTIRPDLVDMESVKKQSARVNLENAFSTAENHLGIARLLDPEDVDVAKPDEKSVMTYVAQFLKAYPEAGEDPALRKKIKTPAEQEMSDYQDLMTWCTTEAEEVLQIVEQPVTDRQQEYMDYLAFKAEVDRRGNIYGKLEEKVKSGKAVRITAEQFAPLEKEWKKVVRQTRLWLWKLDASLPGKLGKFGDWLNQAEEILEQEEEVLENPEEMAALLGKFLQDHKNFFKELEPNRQFFLQVKRAGRYEGEFIPGPQMDNLYQRLQVVCTMAPKRERRLEYEEMKYQLLAYLVASENKLKIWTVKFGPQESVEELLADYKEFVVAGNLFKNYDRTYDTCKRNADAYRKAKIDKEEVEKISNYFDEVNGRWKKVSVEIKSVQSMLEEVIDCWRKYNACVDVLTVWLTEGERVMSRSPEEKQQFFADLPQYEEKHKILNEAGNFLIETTEEPVSVEIKQTLLMLNRRFKDLVDQFQHFKQVEVVGKARKEYSDGLLRLTQWLKEAEELIAQEVPCKHTVLKDYLNEIDKYGAQIPSIENDFKVTTKTAQSLVKESSQDIVTEMLQSLNIQKEVLVRLRKEIPERVKHIKAVLPNVESLETGLIDLNAWLDNGEALLESHRLDGSQEEAEQRLEQHKAFFSEITYQKSIVESKNKVYQKVNTSKPKLKNVDFSVIDQPVEEMNRRFQMCVSRAKDWEKKLENLSRLWRVLNQKQHTLESWLDQAEAVLADTEDDYESIIRKHKGFFVRVDERTLQDYLRAGQDILCVLEEEDRPALTESMENLQQRWEDRLNDVLKRWQEYRGNLETTDQFLKQEFPHWLKETDNDIPDSKNDAQRKVDGVKGMMERLNTMHQEIENAAQRCENLGSTDNLDEADLPHNTPIHKLATQVSADLQHATGEVERRLNGLRDNMQQWDSVDRARADLRAWLHDMQEEVDDLEKQPSKLHAEACEVDISKLQGIREEVQARGPAVDSLLSRYKELTQHNPDLQDPVIKAVKDDWEELLGQVENLIEDREQALQAAKELQARENDMDDDLENYINELEKIESADVATTQKSAMMKTRKPCRSTQTPRGSARNPNRSFLTGDSDNDDDDDSRFLFPPRPRPNSRNSSNPSLKRKRGPGGPRSPSRTSRGSRPGSRFDNLKKSASGAALDSDSEESGYGETYYTMHASSFDNVLDDTVFGTQTPNTMRGTPLGLENHFSDGESTVSYLSTHAYATNPDDMRDGMSQTPGHTSTQTPADMFRKSKPRAMQTQTGSNTSLHSIGNQTRRSSGSRADLLRSILFEVKGIKQQRGLDDSYNGTDDDTNSVRSTNTIKKETLQLVLDDMREIREADATGTCATQTVNEEGTQTSMKLFPEGDPIRNARLEKFKNLMDDVKDMRGSRPGTPGSRSRVSTRSATPVSRQQPRTPSRLNTTFEAPMQNGYHSYPAQNLNATAPASMMNYAMAPPMAPPQYQQPTLIGGRRLVTQEDLNNLNQRIQRLQGYQTPRRATPPPPPPQPQYVIPVYAAPPSRRKPPPQDSYLSDESEYGDAEPPRRRRARSNLEGALAEASRSALQLKRLSKRMKDSLRDDMQYDFL